MDLYRLSAQGVCECMSRLPKHLEAADSIPDKETSIHDAG